MDVRCPHCSTLYEIDESQVRSSVVTLKCSQCQHVFRFEPKTSFVQENQRRWMVRTKKTGDILYLNSFEVLHQWIMERKVNKADEISRTGSKWVELGAIGEFMPVFQVVESISSIANAGQPAAEAEPKTPELDIPPPIGPDGESARERVRTSLQYGGTGAVEEVTRNERPTHATPAPQARAPEPQEPPAPPKREPEPERPPVQLDSLAEPESDAWTIGEPEPTGTQPNFESPRKSGVTPVVVLLLIGAVGAGAYIYQFQPELLQSWMGAATPDREVVKLAQADVGHPNDAAVEVVEVKPQDEVARALTEAWQIQRAQEEGLWDAIIGATRPGFDNALGVATEEAENWAEGGGAPEMLGEARRKLERGQAASALKVYKEVLKLDPGNAEALTGIGWSSIELGRHDDAVANFKAAIAADRRFGDAYIGLGTAERQRGNPKAAFDAYDLYLGRLPKGPKAGIARYQLDQLRKQLGL